jgi:hypothetical protein
MVSGSLSHPSSGVLSSFSRLTVPLSVVEEYLALEGGPPMFSPGFTSPNLLKGLRQLPATGLSPSPARHSSASLFRCRIRFRSPLLTESLLLSFPASTEMFQFPAFAPQRLCIQRWVTHKGRVSPFGHPEITARLPAPSGFSQVPTSFIASRRQDIRHVPLVA